MVRTRLAIVAGTTALVAGALAGTVMAGSKSTSASAVYVTDASWYCESGGTQGAAVVNKETNFITSSEIRVVVQAAANVDPETLIWTLSDKGKQLITGDLDVVASCGVYRIALLDTSFDEDPENDDDDAAIDVAYSGSLTLKVSYNPWKSYGSDSFRLP